MGELPLEVLTQQLRSWRGCEHVVEGSLSKDALRHLLNMTLQAIRQSAWEEALVCSNVMEECSNLDQGRPSTTLTCQHFCTNDLRVARPGEPGLVSWVEEDQFIHKFQAALQLVVASFGEMLEESMLPGGQLEEMESKQTLSALVTSLCGLLLSANRRADQLLPALASGLLCAAATSPGPRLCHEGRAAGTLAFHMLQARRALADVLNTLLEDASQELRAEQDRPPTAFLLADSRPDPKLHEMLVEMLWRGLRRQDDGSPNQAPALELLAALRGPRVARQLKEEARARVVSGVVDAQTKEAAFTAAERSEVSAEHVKDWGIDLALQISRRPEVHYLDCSISWGGLRANECAATFSSHSLHVVGGLLNTEEVSEVQVEFEIPWVFVQNPDAVVARGFPLRLTVLLEPLKACGTLAPGVAELVWLSEGILQIESSVDEGKTKEIFEDLNKLFQEGPFQKADELAQDMTLQSNVQTFESNEDTLATPQRLTRSAGEPKGSRTQDEQTSRTTRASGHRRRRRVPFGARNKAHHWFTSGACIYCLVRPNEQIVALLGKKAFNLAGAMCAIATLCGISSAYGATHILHDTSFRKLVTRVKSSQAPAFTADDDQFNEKDSDWRGRRFDFDWLPMLNLIARLLGYALLIGIPLCPAFESDPMYLLAWLLAVVFLVFFCPGCFYIQTLVVKLSHHHVKGLIEDIEHAAKRKAPGKPAQFWQEMTEKHKKMDRTLETIWDLAMWMVLPHFISSVAFGTIGLVACLTGLATRSDSLALAGLPILLIMLFEVTNRLDEMASITKMCMSTATKTPMTSILASAIAASGKSPWKNDAGCKSVGYNDLADERADHARFLQYLRTNRAGVEAPVAECAEAPAAPMVLEFGQDDPAAMAILETPAKVIAPSQEASQQPKDHEAFFAPEALQQELVKDVAWPCRAAKLTRQQVWAVDFDDAQIDRRHLRSGRNCMAPWRGIRATQSSRNLTSQRLTCAPCPTRTDCCRSSSWVMLGLPLPQIDLVELAKTRGLRANGKKAEILKRLQRWEREQRRKGREQQTAVTMPEHAWVCTNEGGAEPPKAIEERAEAPRDMAKDVVEPIEEPSQPGGGIEAMPLAELRKACEDLGMPSTGSKQALVQRLAIYADTALTPLSQGLEGHVGESSQPPVAGNLELPPESQPEGHLDLPPDSQSYPAGIVDVPTPTRREPGEALAVGTPSPLQIEASPVAWSPRQMPPPSQVPKKAKRASTKIQDLSTMSAKELRQLCQERGISSAGSKAKMLERLVEADEAPAERNRQRSPAPSPAGLWLPPTRSPLEGGEDAMESLAELEDRQKALDPFHTTQNAGDVAAASQASASTAAAATSVLTFLAKNLQALPLEDLQKACSARGLVSAGSRAQLVGRLSALLAQPEEETEASQEVPASMEFLSLPGLQAACRACGLPTNGSAKQMAERLAIHPAESEASPCSIPAAQPDFPSSEDREEEVGTAEQEVPDLKAKDLVETDLLDELPELPERLDDGFRAGLRLLHTEELRRACMERGLDFEGKKGDLLNRLLVHFARAPVPTPTQDVGSLLEPQKPNLHAPPTTPKATEATPTPADAKRSTSKPNLPDPRTVAPPAQTGKAPKCTEKAQSSEAKNDAPKASRAVEKPQELQFPDLRPLPPVVKAPVLRTLLSRPRVDDAPRSAPNFAALWRTMCDGAARSARASTGDAAGAGGGVGLSVAAPCTGIARAAPRRAPKTLRAPRGRALGRVGSRCHGRTVAGAPCRNSAHHWPSGAQFMYCGRHKARWARFESVRVDELKPLPSKLGQKPTLRPVATPARGRPAPRPPAPVHQTSTAKAYVRRWRWPKVRLVRNVDEEVSHRPKRPEKRSKPSDQLESLPREDLPTQTLPQDSQPELETSCEQKGKSQDDTSLTAKAKPRTRAALQSAKLKKPPAKDKKSQNQRKGKSQDDKSLTASQRSTKRSRAKVEGSAGAAQRLGQLPGLSKVMALLPDPKRRDRGSRWVPRWGEQPARCMWACSDESNCDSQPVQMQPDKIFTAVSWIIAHAPLRWA
eukprot:g29897.t2